MASIYLNSTLLEYQKITVQTRCHHRIGALYFSYAVKGECKIHAIYQKVKAKCSKDFRHNFTTFHDISCRPYANPEMRSSDVINPPVRKLMSQDNLVTHLSNIRYPNKEKAISSATLCRWRKLINLKPRKYYTLPEVTLLAEIATLLKRGYSYEEVTHLFRNDNHGQSNSQSRDRSPRQSASQPQYSDNIWDF